MLAPVSWGASWFCMAQVLRRGERTEPCKTHVVFLITNSSCSESLARCSSRCMRAHRDAKLRDEALRAVKGIGCNIAEGAGRVTRADKARAFTIARGECVEAAAAIEIAALSGPRRRRALGRWRVLADRVVAMLTGLIRR